MRNTAGGHFGAHREAVESFTYEIFRLTKAHEATNALAAA